MRRLPRKRVVRQDLSRRALRHFMGVHFPGISRQGAKLKAQGIQAFSYEFLGVLAANFQSQGPTRNAAEPPHPAYYAPKIFV